MALLKKIALLQVFKTTRSIQTSAIASNSFKKWAYYSGGFHKLGLYLDDLMDEDHNMDVKEAVRRLPQHLVDERNYRHLRAIQLNIQKSILPQNQWTKFEEDVPYLRHLVEEVAKERKERELWESTH